MEFDLTKPYCHYFNEITKIPHGSNNEKGLSDYLVNFAKDLGLAYIQDDMFNVIIYKSGTVGYEQSEPLMIQAHIDMVCEKNKDSSHDFRKDPLKLIIRDGFLCTEGTTLGADDGTGVAYMMAILADKDGSHPPLECVFTVQEETGLFGAMHLKAQDIKARRMISLDGGGETNTLLSSSGGCRDKIVKRLEFEANTKPTFRLSVKGLLGGHSGGEIHKEKGNANKLVMRLFKEACLSGLDLRIVSYSGGLKDNAIPREAEIEYVSSDDPSKILGIILKSESEIKEELEYSDSGFKVIIESLPVAAKCLTQTCSTDVCDFVYLFPNGFKARSMAIPGLTLTSLNLGVVETKEDQLILSVSIRSAIRSGIDNLIREIACLCERFDATYTTSAFYPGWNYSKVSPLRNILSETVKKIYDNDLELIAAHGGVECGVFKAMHSTMDIVSIGPITKDIHTPEERLDLSSFDRTYVLLTQVVSACK